MQEPAHSNAQAAIEYLTTYGWAILIVAIVIVALFYLGGLGGNSGPRAPPGSCSVSRPNGAYTIQFIALSGTCGNELPEFVSQLSGSGYVYIESNLSLGDTNNITLAGWIETTKFVTNDIKQNVISVKGAANCGAVLAVNNSRETVEFELSLHSATHNGIVTLFAPSNSVGLDKWYFLAGTYNGTVASIYEDDVLLETFSETGVINDCDAPTYIGSGLSGNALNILVHFWNGNLSNVQVYKSSLSEAEVEQIYEEGIGGSPGDLQSLLGWWPLNENGDDYSGNNNNGQPYEAMYNNQWYTVSDYTTP